MAPSSSPSMQPVVPVEDVFFNTALPTSADIVVSHKMGSDGSPTQPFGLDELLQLASELENSCRQRHGDAMRQVQRLTRSVRALRKSSVVTSDACEPLYQDQEEQQSHQTMTSLGDLGMVAGAEAESKDLRSAEASNGHGEASNGNGEASNDLGEDSDCFTDDKEDEENDLPDAKRKVARTMTMNSMISKSEKKAEEMLDKWGHVPCCGFIKKKRLAKMQKALDAGMVGSGLFRSEIKTSKFDACIGFAIILNVVLMFIQLQIEGDEAGMMLIQGGHVESSAAKESEWVFEACEYVFNALFVVELIVRLYVLRLGYFRELSHLFDFMLVVVNSIELMVLQPLQMSVGANVTILRWVRFFRLFRVLRLVRVMKLFRELRILVQTIGSSLVAVGWSMVLMGMMIIASALILCQMLTDFVNDTSNDEDTRNWVWIKYGTSSRAAWTMFEATFSGCWPEYSAKLINHVSPLYSVFWILYIAGAVFAVTRIISASFVKEALHVAGQQSDLMAFERMRHKELYIKQLREFFIEADQSGDGLVDRQEFDDIMANPKVIAWLQALELEVHETSALFNLLADGNGHITSEDFLQGVVRLKGQARCVDVVAILRDVSRIAVQLESLEESFRRTFHPNDPVSPKPYLSPFI